MLHANTTIAIILGVSECPRAPRLQALPQCANSAQDFAEYLHNLLGLPSTNVNNLFDSSLSAGDQIEQIEEWLAGFDKASPPPTDLLFYYTGHGGFTRSDQAYFLATRRTKEGSEGATSIRYSDLALAIKRHANSIRKFFVFDCCFAAATVFRSQADLHQLVNSRIEDEMPTVGTAVLCSSSAKLVSLAPEGERYTMFSGGLLDCLKNGIPSGPEFLSLHDIRVRANWLIRQKFPLDAVRPELHVPDQSEGDPAGMPLFPNRASFLFSDASPITPPIIGSSPGIPSLPIANENHTGVKKAWPLSYKGPEWLQGALLLVVLFPIVIVAISSEFISRMFESYFGPPFRIEPQIGRISELTPNSAKISIPIHLERTAAYQPGMSCGASIALEGMIFQENYKFFGPAASPPADYIANFSLSPPPSRLAHAQLRLVCVGSVNYTSDWMNVEIK